MSQPSGMPDPFEFIKSLWGPFGTQMPGMVTPTLDPAEVDKRIADLKSVENWLNLNLNVLRMTIQGLEMQKATLSAVNGMAESARAMQDAMQSTQPPAPPGGGAAPQDAWFDMLRQAQEAADKARAGTVNPPKDNNK
jgi:hypothetical protein